MKLLAIAALVEGATGLVLMAYPPIVVRLLLGAELPAAGIVISRIAGISLLALGLACWPGNTAAGALSGMLTYNTLATLYLAYLGLGGNWVGLLLWPVVVLHGALTCLLAIAWFKARKTGVRS